MQKVTSHTLIKTVRVLGLLVVLDPVNRRSVQDCSRRCRCLFESEVYKPRLRRKRRPFGLLSVSLQSCFQAGGAFSEGPHVQIFEAADWGPIESFDVSVCVMADLGFRKRRHLIWVGLGVGAGNLELGMRECKIDGKTIGSIRHAVLLENLGLMGRPAARTCFKSRFDNDRWVVQWQMMLSSLHYVVTDVPIYAHCEELRVVGGGAGLAIQRTGTSKRQASRERSCAGTKAMISQESGETFKTLKIGLGLPKPLQGPVNVSLCRRLRVSYINNLEVAAFMNCRGRLLANCK